MALTIYSSTPATWDTRIDTMGAVQLLKIGMEGAQAVSQAPTVQDGVLALLVARRASFGWDFEVSAKTTASETATALDLTAAGVTFPAGSSRLIEWEVFGSGSAFATDEALYLKKAELIIGGTTPQVGLAVFASANIIATNTAGARATGFAATPASAITLATNNVIITVTSAEAEIVNFFLRVKVGRLQPVLLGV